MLRFANFMTTRAGISASLVGGLLLAACGVSVHPRVEGFQGPGGAFPQPDRGSGGVVPAPPERPRAGAGLTRQICRGSMPRGWIAVRYVTDADCPTPPDEGNPYSSAIIRKYSELPLGARLVVCADQGLPSGWVREPADASHSACTGAKVREGAATVYVMRRVRYP